MVLAALAWLTVEVGLEEGLLVRLGLGQGQMLMAMRQEGRMGFEVGVPRGLVRMNCQVEEPAVALPAGKVWPHLLPFVLVAWRVDTLTSPLRAGHWFR